MAAPWGAIIQAIDHAMGRMQHGAEAGIRVSGSNTGGAATNTTTGAGTATGSGGEAAIPQTKESTTPAADSGSTDSKAAAMPDVSSEGQKGDSDIGANVSETGEAAGESENDGDIMSMLSDANAKNSTDVSSDEGKASGKGSKAAAIMGSAKKWAEGASKGFANAGAIATGNKAAYSYKTQDTGEATDSIDWQKAKEWAEKAWKNRRNKKEDASKTSDK
jgi:hypothetical protein